MRYNEKIKLKSSILKYTKKKVFSGVVLFFFIFFPFTNLISQKIYGETNFINKTDLKTPPYKLGPGDSIYMKISNVEGFEANVRIIPDGTVSLPRIGQVNLMGLTIEEAKQKITAQYERIIKRPLLYLDLRSTRPIRVSISGQVQRPGIYSLTSNENNRIANSDGGEVTTISSNGWPTLIDAIQKAGGINHRANLKNIVIKRKINNLEYVSLKVNYWDSIVKGSIFNNPLIYDGDNIIISKAKKLSTEESIKISESNLAAPSITVNVIGEVKKPGPYGIKANSPLSQAILSAGGISNRGKRNNIELVRLNPNGSVNVRSLKFNYKSLKNSNLNPPLIDGDIIVVNRSTWTALNDSFKNIVQPVGPILNSASIYRLLTD